MEIYFLISLPCLTKKLVVFFFVHMTVLYHINWLPDKTSLISLLEVSYFGLFCFLLLEMRATESCHWFLFLFLVTDNSFILY